MHYVSNEYSKLQNSMLKFPISKKKFGVKHFVICSGQLSVALQPRLGRKGKDTVFVYPVPWGAVYLSPSDLTSTLELPSSIRTHISHPYPPVRYSFRRTCGAAWDSAWQKAARSAAHIVQFSSWLPLKTDNGQ